MADLAIVAGLPSPEIEELSGCLTVRFRRANHVPTRIAENDSGRRQDAILALLEQMGGGLALREIVAHMAPSASERQVKRALRALRDQGLAAPAGRGAAARWKRIRSGENE